eukprot:TRINITY_DN361_c0_g3_i1.p1 TRINITY_DN361_c0_g3~~TRINITY_DN361_c0_g3_i1.p1  ORF type:complete len:733 (-),score=244.62 TRINITY_DN361_c0_g3_i1:366-2516(-)
MKSATSLLLLSSFGSSDATGRTSGAAISKVIDMLNDMSAKTQREKMDDEVAFAKFSTWCKQETAELTAEIQGNGAEIEALAASEARLRSEAKTLGDAIATLQGDVEGFEGDRKKQQAQRETDHAAFLEESQDYSESVSAVERALVVLAQQSHDRPADSAAAAALLEQFESMLQNGSQRQRAPASMPGVVAALQAISRDGEPAGHAYDAPEANAYEFQSSGIVDMLKKLKDEFREKLGECQKSEMNSKHAFDMIEQDLSDSIANAKKDISEKSMEKERKLSKAAMDKKQLAATTESKAQNEQTLSETSTECKEKSLSYEEKQQLRAEEIEAIAKAVEILASPKVAGHGETHLSFAQANAVGTALVQGREFLESQSSGIHRRVREFLASEGNRLHSQKLGLLAEKMAAAPFAKVTKMIESMINRLMNEANEDANHQGFCDTEMGKSKITRAKLSEDVEALNAAVEEGKATILELANEVETLTKEVADLDKAVAEASDMRADEKKKNAATVKDAREAKDAVTAATAVLKDFYSKALEATALLQTKEAGVKLGSDEWNSLANPDFKGTVDKGHKSGMQTFGATYKGKQDQAGGVLAMLDVILSDFATLEADTEADEATSAKAHEQFLTSSKRDKAVKSRQIEMSTADRTRAEEKLQVDTRDMKATQDELLAAERYHEKLVPQCVDQGMTFEERTAARAAEIASLKEALKILDSPDVDTSA